MRKSGYIYKITEKSTGRIYIGVKLGGFDPFYFGSPREGNDLWVLYNDSGILDLKVNNEKRRERFLRLFDLEILEENARCDLSPDWSEDKTLTLEGAYKKYKFPECLKNNGGFNQNIDRVNSFPFILECVICQGKSGSHRKNCEKVILCEECGTVGGKHKKTCSKSKNCSECGSKNPNHKKDLGNGIPCSKYTPEKGLNHSRFLKQWAKTERGQKHLSEMGKQNKGKSKPDSFVEYRKNVFTENNPMKDPEKIAQMRQTKKENFEKFTTVIICINCGKEKIFRGKSPKRLFCGPKCSKEFKNTKTNSIKTEVKIK